MADDPIRLHHEKLDVYKVAYRLQIEARDIVPKRGHRALRDQLDRAMASILLNIAEGAGRRAPREKRQFYAIARGSTTEVAAILDVVRARGLATAQRCETARALVVRIVQMLSKLTELRDRDRDRDRDRQPLPTPELRKSVPEGAEGAEGAEDES